MAIDLSDKRLFSSENLTLERKLALQRSYQEEADHLNCQNIWTVRLLMKLELFYFHQLHIFLMNRRILKYRQLSLQISLVASRQAILPRVEVSISETWIG